jgi:uncharacterized protein YabE (DUF348 family)
MAGLGRKVFAAGEVLTAANVNGYLMDQAVMVFDDSASRTSALGTAVSEGMMSYLKDTNGVQVYDGSSWVAVVSDPTFTSSTATAYTVASSDAGNFLRFTAAGTVTVSTATAFSAGQQVQLFADGTALTVTTDGATLGGAGTAGTATSFTVGAQYEALSIFCVDTDTYRIIGNITAV